MAGETVEEIAERVARDRSSLADTLDAFGEAVAPARLAEKAADATRGAGNGFSTRVIEKARNNPAALALTGAGLAMLWARRGQGRDALQGTTPDPTRFTIERSYIMTKAQASSSGNNGSAKSAAREKAEDVRDDVAEKVGQARETAEDVRDKAEEVRSDVTDATRRRVKQGRSLVQNNPVLAVTGALGVGVLIGMALRSRD